MNPLFPLPGSMTFSGKVSANSLSLASLSSSAALLFLAFTGSMTNLSGSLTMPGSTFRSMSSPGVTTPFTWDTRVVVRINTGVSKASLISKARLVNSFASKESAGSSMGIFAAKA